LPAKRALIRTRTVALNVTELSTWPTSGESQSVGRRSRMPLRLTSVGNGLSALRIIEIDQRIPRPT
jgi:hypothetical protein